MSMTDIFQAAASLVGGSLNRYQLDIPSCQSPLDVENFNGSEALSENYHYDIQFTSPDKDISAASMLRKTATLSMGTGVLTSLTGKKVVHGYITDFRRLSGSEDQASYLIVIEPHLALLDKQYRTHRFFVNRSVREVVQQILQEHGFRDWEYEFNLQQDYPKREQINQYHESDLQFIRRILAEVGIFYWFSLQQDTQTEVIQFGDSQSALTYGKTLPLNSPSGMHDVGTESVWGLIVIHNVVEAGVITKDYNHRDANRILRSAPADMTRGDGAEVNYGQVYHYRPRHPESGDKFTPAVETANFYAHLDHERFLARQVLINGICNDAMLGPAQELTVIDGILPTLPAMLQAPFIITRIHVSASRKSALQTTFNAVPYSEIICWRPALLPRPRVSGTMTARITSAKAHDTYAWQDDAGLYRVMFDADEDSRAPGQESMPVRLAKPYGGDTYGMHFPLIQGTEVAIAFHEGDPDRPYIAHALHDSRHSDHVTADNNTRNVIRTAGLNKLRMEDKRGEEHIKLSTEYGGKTQLNLGHNVDSSRTLRGEGFELRSDKWGALRAGKGIFITADKQVSAVGKMLEMQGTLDRLKQAGDQMESLSGDAQSAKAEPAQVEAQLAFMHEQIEQLKEAVAVLSAPQGIALSSGKHLQMTASSNLMLNAGADADMGVMKRLFIGAGEGFSLFVRKIGMKLIANQGPVTIQAQNDRLQLLARNGLEIVSTQDEIQIIAKKKITLNAGGSYLTLDPYKIEAGSDGDFAIKAADFTYNGPASMKADHPEYSPLQSNARQLLRLSVPQTPNAPGSSWAGMPYTLLADGALLSKGVLDKGGEVQVEHQVVVKNYTLEMANGTRYQIPVVDAYRNPEQGELANRGLHNHALQPGGDITAPASHTTHRGQYAELLDGLNDKESGE